MNLAKVLVRSPVCQTAVICEKILSDIPLYLIKNKASMFADEVRLRKIQWKETTKTHPDWILNMEADELVEDTFWKNSQTVLCDAQLESSCAVLQMTDWQADEH